MRFVVGRRVALLGILVLSICGVFGAPAKFVWPTPNKAFAEGKSYAAFIQPTISGKVESGLFGCVRTDSRQFHEGIDIKAIKHDRHGEPLDDVYAIHAGIIRHISDWPGNSNYGRYIVIEHTDIHPSILSLYAHLRFIRRGLKVGDRVKAGELLGGMGHSSGAHGFDKRRSHLHLEVGVRLSDRFDRWYDAQHYGSRNLHGNYNGYNITGFDYLYLLTLERQHKVTGVLDYLQRLPTAVTVRVVTDLKPDFVTRYPRLVAGPIPRDLAGWLIEFTWYGLPKRWQPLTPAELGKDRRQRCEIVYRDKKELDIHPCLSMVKDTAHGMIAGEKLEEQLAIIFGPDFMKHAWERR